MNEYPIDNDEDAGLDDKPETLDDDLEEDALAALTQPDDVNVCSPNERAVQIRRAIELHRERAALRDLLDDTFY